MNTLIFSKKIPFGSDDGENIVIMQDWSSIKDELENVSFFCLDTQKNKVSYNQTENNFPVYVQKIDTTNILKTGAFFLTKKLPIHIARYYDPKVLDRLIKLIEEQNINRIICHGLACVMYANLIKNTHPQLEIIYRVHNVESNIWYDLSKNSNNPIKKLLYLTIARQLFNYEANKLCHVKHFIVLNNNEKEFYKNNYPNANTTIIAIFISSYKSNYSKSNLDKKNLLITGSMNWKPNIEGLTWFLKNIWPKIMSEIPGITITIAGKGVEKLKIHNKINHNVIIKGSFDHIEDLFNDSTMLIIPVFSGAGIRIKMLEAMEYGMPVVSTPKGVEGIKTIEGTTAHNALDDIFLKEIVDLFKDKKRLLEVSNKMKESMTTFYSESNIKPIWKIILNDKK